MRSFVILIFLLPAIIFSQELDASVNVNYEQLPTAAKERLENFAQDVENYLNNNRFTGDSWEGDRIKCNFTVFFTSSSEEVRYSAQLVTASLRPVFGTQKNSLMLNIRDENWNFRYEKNQAMYFNLIDFDPLTSLLDFYAYLIIGFDMDSFGPEPLGGSDLFSKAHDLTILGSNSNFSDGWVLSSSSYNRRMLVENLMNAKFQQFRQDYLDYHYNGIDIYFKYKDRAQKSIVKMIKNLEIMKDKIDPRSVLLKVFFDAKSGEIVDYLKDYPDKLIFLTLKKIDPPHISKYDEILYN